MILGQRDNDWVRELQAENSRLARAVAKHEHHVCPSMPVGTRHAIESAVRFLDSARHKVASNPVKSQIDHVLMDLEGILIKMGGLL